MDEKRKVWQKPELIVLVRSKPEEAVLVHCKNWGTWPHSNAASVDAACAYDGCGTPCNAIGDS